MANNMAISITPVKFDYCRHIESSLGTQYIHPVYLFGRYSYATK